jgi:hypothetical protein
MASVPLSHELHPIFLLDSFDMETTTPCPNRYDPRFLWEIWTTETPRWDDRYKINTFSATFFSIFVNTLMLGR